MRPYHPHSPGARLLLFVALAFLAGCAAIPPPRAFVNLAGPHRAVAAAERPAFNARVFDETWDWVNRRYYDAKFNGADWAAARARHRPAALAAADDAALYAALNALLAELRDGHARAWTPAEVAQRKRPNGVLLGFRTGPRDGHADHRVVLEVFPGGAAARAGVEAGWILLSADGRPPGEVLGPGKLHEGRAVRCEFLDRAGRPRALALEPHAMRIPPVRVARVLDDGALLLRFDYFTLPTARWVRAQLKAHRGANGVIFDLRGNGGGDSFSLTGMLSEIFPEPVAVGRTVVRSGDDSHHRTPRAWFGAGYRGPVAVLVSEHSASAAEIFAHVVQHHRRGPVIGRKTPGLVLVSVFWWLPGGGELQLSVYDYEGPGGVRLEGRGVTPDVVVEPASPEGGTVDPVRDPVVRAAQAAIKTKPGR